MLNEEENMNITLLNAFHKFNIRINILIIENNEYQECYYAWM